METYSPETPKRNKYWVTEFYPESLDIDLVISRLHELHICAFISPVHDSDVNPDGEVKKAHYHVILIFDSLKSFDQVQEIVEFLGTVGCFYCVSFRGYARYLCHLDNPEKHQYNIDSVYQIGDISYFEVISSTADKIELMGEICEFCYNFEIFDFSYIVLWSYHQRKLDWLECLRNQAIFFRTFLSSLAYSYRMYNKLPEYTWDIEHDSEFFKKIREQEKKIEQTKLMLQKGGID